MMKIVVFYQSEENHIPLGLVVEIRATILLFLKLLFSNAFIYLNKKI